MKVGIETICYREERFIERCINQFKGFPVHHLVLVSDTPWHGEKEAMDKTVDIAESLGAEVVVSDWLSEPEQRNFGLQQLKDCDWVLVVDADEFYSKEDIDKWLKFLEHAPYDAYGIGRIKTYWKDENHIIDPEESGGLIVAVRPKAVQFTDKRCITGDWDFLPEDIVMNHYSYVRTDGEMKRKLASFEHADEIMDGWYEEKWKGWDKDNNLEDLHPVNPKSFRGTKYVG
jgi:glycosyltransferase involved in cell wall biosynthesis